MSYHNLNEGIDVERDPYVYKSEHRCVTDGRYAEEILQRTKLFNLGILLNFFLKRRKVTSNFPSNSSPSCTVRCSIFLRRDFQFFLFLAVLKCRPRS